MAVKLSQGLKLKQTQSLAMTPQLQQAIKLLTLTHLEMTDVIASEMVENPMLEESGQVVSKDEISDIDRKVEKLENQNQEATSDNFDGPSVLNKDKSVHDDFDWQGYVEAYNSTTYTPPNMAKQDLDDVPNYENILSGGEGLADHLEWQLRMLEFSDEEWSVLDHIIHNINDDGYLDVEIEDICKETGHDLEDAIELLMMVQRLEPVGCGARSLSESLMAQAKSLEIQSPLVEKIIYQCLDELQQNNTKKVAKELEIDELLVKEAFSIIHQFHPKPGRLIAANDTHYVAPDIYVVEIGGEFVVQVNDEGVPRLRISKQYQSLISDDSNKEAQEYVKEKLKSASFLIKSIYNRQNTIYKVAKTIVERQQEFFKKGPRYLKPMVLKDVAQDIGMHESTISRATTNKYMHTPIGMFELKYFFNSGVGGKNGGDDVASEVLKIKIKDLVAKENPKKPLSDQKIVEILGRDGVALARRTVAKYREQLGILSSSKRKKKD
jgi:RNA polymerase sigma-54 factor